MTAPCAPPLTLNPALLNRVAAITAYDALRPEIGSEKGSEMRSEIGATPGAAIDALILRDLATEPTLSARLLRHGSSRAGYWQVL